MRDKVVRLIRKRIYGDLARRPVHYRRNSRTGQIRCWDARKAYLEAKKIYKATGELPPERI